MNDKTRTCPYCGAALPEEASFCPHCARSVNRRAAVRMPWSRRRLALAVCAVAAAGLIVLGLWFLNRPRVYDSGGAEVFYTDADGTYQVLAGWMDNRFYPADRVRQPVDPGDMLYTFPQCLFVNYPDSGANAKDAFMEKVERVTVEFYETENEELPWTCDQPVPRENYIPEAALVSSIHFYADSGEGSARWTIEMKNGDVIRLHQTMQALLMELYRFTPEDTPLDTTEDLQALLDSLDDVTGGEGLVTVEIHLPPVTYDGEIIIPRSVNLYGAEEGGRTVFAGPVHVYPDYKSLSWFYDLDFVGDGSSIGISVSSDVFLAGCRVAGWRTGVLVQDQWVSAFDCVFEDNEVGFHFNSDSGSPMDDRFQGDVFRSNGTGLLFERVPNGETLAFPGAVFSGNGTDIDNRCELPLDLSEATFE